MLPQLPSSSKGSNSKTHATTARSTNNVSQNSIEVSFMVKNAKDRNPSNKTKFRVSTGNENAVYFEPNTEERFKFTFHAVVLGNQSELFDKVLKEDMNRFVSQEGYSTVVVGYGPEGSGTTSVIGTNGHCFNQFGFIKANHGLLVRSVIHIGNSLENQKLKAVLTFKFDDMIKAEKEEQRVIELKFDWRDPLRMKKDIGEFIRKIAKALMNKGEKKGFEETTFKEHLLVELHLSKEGRTTGRLALYDLISYDRSIRPPNLQDVNSIFKKFPNLPNSFGLSEVAKSIRQRFLEYNARKIIFTSHPYDEKFDYKAFNAMKIRLEYLPISQSRSRIESEEDSNPDEANSDGNVEHDSGTHENLEDVDRESYEGNESAPEDCEQPSSLDLSVATMSEFQKCQTREELIKLAALKINVEKKRALETAEKLGESNKEKDLISERNAAKDAELEKIKQEKEHLQKQLDMKASTSPVPVKCNSAPKVRLEVKGADRNIRAGSSKEVSATSKANTTEALRLAGLAYCILTRLKEPLNLKSFAEELVQNVINNEKTHMEWVFALEKVFRNFPNKQAIFTETKPHPILGKTYIYTLVKFTDATIENYKSFVKHNSASFFLAKEMFLQEAPFYQNLLLLESTWKADQLNPSQSHQNWKLLADKVKVD